MNKKAILKIILSIITIALIISLTTSVFAEDDEGAVDLSGSITNKEDTSDDKDTTGNKENTTNKDTTGNKENTTNKDTTGNKENTTNKDTTGNKENTTNKDTTVDKNIPQTGLADTMAITILFVACGVVGVYTFIKLSQYSNI